MLKDQGGALSGVASARAALHDDGNPIPNSTTSQDQKMQAAEKNNNTTTRSSCDVQRQEQKKQKDLQDVVYDLVSVLEPSTSREELTEIQNEIVAMALSQRSGQYDTETLRKPRLQATAEQVGPPSAKTNEEAGRGEGLDPGVRRPNATKTSTASATLGLGVREMDGATTTGPKAAAFPSRTGDPAQAGPPPSHSQPLQQPAQVGAFAGSSSSYGSETEKYQFFSTKQFR